MLGALERLRPDLKPVTLGPTIPREPFRGRVWVFIDWLLPELSGLELCRRLREADSTRNAHLTIVLESADPDARRRALQAGADDYVVGPLTPEILLDRIDGGVSERPHAVPGKRLQHGELSVDLAAYQARYRGKILPLRPNEFRLLVHFIENPDQVYSRTSLIDRLGKDEQNIDERTVDVWIGRLRRCLRAQSVPDPLRTVRSMGYVLDSIAL
jgi:two-component system phosphate regulon response regulator PhoB